MPRRLELDFAHPPDNAEWVPEVPVLSKGRPMPAISPLVLPRLWTAAAICVVCLTTALLAVEKDKAVYIGGSPGFPARSGRVLGFTTGKVGGNLDIKSEAGLTFEAGRW